MASAAALPMPIPEVYVYCATPLAALAIPSVRAQLFALAPNAARAAQSIRTWFETDEYWTRFSAWPPRRAAVLARLHALATDPAINPWTDHQTAEGANGHTSRGLERVDVATMMTLPMILEELAKARPAAVSVPLVATAFFIAVDAARTRTLDRLTVREWAAYAVNAAVVTTEPDPVFQHVYVDATDADVQLLLAPKLHTGSGGIDPTTCISRVVSASQFVVSMPSDAAINAFRTAFQQYSGLAETAAGVRLL